MLRNILNIPGVEELTKVKSVDIKGGFASASPILAEADSYTCQCSGSVGKWTGNYSSQSAADKSITTWCASGKGSCNKN